MVWGKNKDYESSSAITEEHVLPAKQTVEKSNDKEEHSNFEVITLSNLGTGNIARDEQVWGNIARDEQVRRNITNSI